MAIYDNTKDYLTAEQIKEKTGCDAVFNGGLYDMMSRKSDCNIKAEGTWLNRENWDLFGYTWNNGELPKMTLTKDSDKDNVFSCIPVIQNGEKLGVDDNASGVGKSRGRTAFGFRADGVTCVALCTSDSEPMTLSEVRDKLFALGCANAVICDGGGSAQIICEAGTITSSRRVATYICAWKEKSTIYRVQVGAFSSMENARRLQEKLTAQGYSTIIKSETK